MTTIPNRKKIEECSSGMAGPMPALGTVRLLQSLAWLPSRSLGFLGLAALLVFVLPALAHGQGLLVNIQPDESVALPRPTVIIWPPHPPHPPRPPRPIPPRPVPESTYKIKAIEVNARLSEQVARVQVSQSFVNTGSRQMEVCFVFPLPYDGAVDQLTLLVDGKEYAARLLDAKQARRLYEQIVRKNQDPALLEWIGTGLFKTSVFPVPPGAERKVTLRYSQLCRKADGLTDLLFPLSTARYTSHPVEEVKFRVTIDSALPIKNVYSPTHSVEIQRPDEQHATITYTAKNQVPTSDFRLFYDVGKDKLAASVISYRPDAGEDGYFVLLASPPIKAPDQQRPNKTVLFVVDRSGSMSGEKIEQAKGAVKFVLNNLREGDLFNIIAYDSEIESWRPELQRFDENRRKAALGFVEGLYAGGSTNINAALLAALKQLQDSSRPNFVIFLTDGLPTVGETNEAKIAANVRQANGIRARLFVFGVGYDLNSRLLDKLSRENFGSSEYVRPNEDIEARVSSLYNRIGAPVMTDVEIAFDVEGLKPEQGAAINRVYPKDVRDLFAGEQLVLVGRYKKPGEAKVVIRGQVGQRSERFDFPAKLVERSDDESYAFVEKLWAMRRVGEILDQIDLHGKNEELVKELVQLATRHGILTPYTSFLADETSNLRDLAANAAAAGRRLDALREESGRLGFDQRLAKGALQRATNAPAAGFGGAGLELYADAASIAAGGQDKVDAALAVQNVRNIGRKTFYRRGNQWVDSSLNEAQENSAVRVERYSREFFELIDRHGRHVARYLTIEGPVLIELDGRAYAF